MLLPDAFIDYSSNPKSTVVALRDIKHLQLPNIADAFAHSERLSRGESMASPAHCFFCFESLDASYGRRSAPRLQKVLELYEKYAQRDAIAGEEATDHLEQDEEDRGRSTHDGAGEDDMTDGGVVAPSTTASTLRPYNPSISRLQNSSSSSRSSSASSPSTLSAHSSQSHLTGHTSISSNTARPSYASRLSVTESFPLFVTWNTMSRSGHKSLRGCIGTFEGLPLESGLQTYALTSAFDDTRFSPIPSSLLPALSCSLTLLADFEPCSDAMDWSLGTHGLRISFNWRSRRYGATYLPDVAVDQGWTKDETLESLMKKAGWDGGYQQGVARRLLRGSSRGDLQQPKPWDEVDGFRVVRYTGLKSSATYTEWKEWREWCRENGENLR